MIVFIIHAMILFVLAVLTCFDMKYRKLPVILIGAMVLSVLADWILLKDFADVARYAGVLFGIGFCILSLLTRQSIGLGDTILFAILGGYLGIYKLLLLLFAAFCLSAVFAAVLLLLKKGNLRTGIPFLPFLYLVFCGMCVME